MQKRGRKLIMTDLELKCTNSGLATSEQQQHKKADFASTVQQLLQSGEKTATVPPDLAAAPTKRQREPNNQSGSSDAAGDCSSSQKKRPKLSTEEQWNAMFERLREYKRTRGDCNVPKRHPELGTWVDTQRVQYRKQRMMASSTGGGLTMDRIKRLESLGFVWNPRKSRAQEERILERQRLYEEKWEDYYQRLAHFKALHGNTLVPRKYADDPDLSAWVEMMRALWNRDYRSRADPNLQVPEVITAPIDAEVNHTASDAAGLSNEVRETIGEPASVENPLTDDAAAAAVLKGLIGAPARAWDATSPPPDSLEVPLPIKGLTKERKEKLDRLGFVWCVRMKQFDDQWDEMFRQLLEYKNAHGDCLVPSRFEENVRLGKWVETQRYEYTKLHRSTSGNEQSAPTKPAVSRLTAERQRRLEAIGFEWKVKNKMKRFYDKQWDQMFDRLLEYQKTFGNTRVPRQYPDDPKLASWAHSQRSQYRKIKKSNESPESITKDVDGSRLLTEDRWKRLSEIRFEWTAVTEEKPVVSSKGELSVANQLSRTAYDDQWDTMYERLRSFREKNGHCLVPKRYEDAKLGTWVDTQRVQYKRMAKKAQEDGPPTGKASSSRLTPARIQRLEDLGFVWSVRDDWNKHYEELKQYRQEHGNCNVPARHLSNKRLGVWVSSQRQQYKILQGVSKSKRRTVPLTQERIDKLNALDFTWSIRSSSDNPRDGWTRRVTQLKEFKSAYGHLLIPSPFDANPELGLFADTLRNNINLFIQARQQGRALPPSCLLTDERLRQLVDIGFVVLSDQSILRQDTAAQQGPTNDKVEIMMDMMENTLDSSSRSMSSSSEDGSSFSGQYRHAATLSSQQGGPYANSPFRNNNRGGSFSEIVQAASYLPSAVTNPVSYFGGPQVMPNSGSTSTGGGSGGAYFPEGLPHTAV